MTARPRADQFDPRLIAALGITQIISWGTLYYSFSLLLDPLQTELGATRGAVAGAFSCALIAGGAVTAWIGRAIDRAGGRAVMTIGSLAGALLLAALSQVQSLGALYAIWVGLGFAMAATLYEPAFAVVTRAFPLNYRRAITWLTLFGGFASTVFWPLTTFLIEWLGWRSALLVLAAINLGVCAPVHAWVLRSCAQPTAATPEAEGHRLGEALRQPAFYALATAFLCHLLVISAVAVHLIVLLTAKGVTASHAALIGALIGPMQVAGRFVELLLAHRWRASRLGLVAVLLMPLALLLLDVGGDVVTLACFAALYGVSNGTMTIVRGAVPVEWFGRASYGAIAGWLTTPGLLARAGGPLVAAALWSATGDASWVARSLALIAMLGAVSYVLAMRVARRG